MIKSELTISNADEMSPGPCRGTLPLRLEMENIRPAVDNR